MKVNEECLINNNKKKKWIKSNEINKKNKIDDNDN